MNTIQHFGLSESQIIRKNNDFYLPISKLAEVLEISKQNVYQIIQRNKEDFEGVNLMNTPLQTRGGVQNALLLSEDAVYIFCMLTTKSEKAKDFRRMFAKMIKAIRSKEFVHITEYQNVVLQLEEATDRLNLKQIETSVLSKIPPKKLSRYKRFRDMKLSRKEACKALELPYGTMRKADKVLGYYHTKNVDHLKPYYIVAGTGRKRQYQLEEATLFSEV